MRSLYLYSADLYAAGVVVSGLTYAGAGSSLVRRVSAFCFVGGDAEGFEEGQVVSGEGAVGGFVAVFTFGGFGFVFNLVEADGASSMRMTSKPCSRISRTTPAMDSDSATDSWMASPSF